MPEPKKVEKDPKYEEARAHMREAHDALHEAFDALMPAGFRENRRKARREMLLAFRSMLDVAIEKDSK